MLRAPRYADSAILHDLDPEAQPSVRRMSQRPSVGQERFFTALCYARSHYWPAPLCQRIAP